jgi:hypothetical protein
MLDGCTRIQALHGIGSDPGRLTRHLTQARALRADPLIEAGGTAVDVKAFQKVAAVER